MNAHITAAWQVAFIFHFLSLWNESASICRKFKDKWDNALNLIMKITNILWWAQNDKLLPSVDRISNVLYVYKMEYCIVLPSIVENVKFLDNSFNWRLLEFEWLYKNVFHYQRVPFHALDTIGQFCHFRLYLMGEVKKHTEVAFLPFWCVIYNNLIHLRFFFKEHESGKRYYILFFKSLPSKPICHTRV